MKITIRHIKPADVPAVSDLVSSCYSFLAQHQGFSAAQLQRLISERCSPECIEQTCHEFERYIAESSDDVVGMVGLRENDVAELWVSPDFHHQRIGAQLFAKAEDLIRSRGHAVLTVRTTGFAVPFYQAMGCRILEKKACPFGPLEGWVMTHLEKNLNKTGSGNRNRVPDGASGTDAGVEQHHADSG